MGSVVWLLDLTPYIQVPKHTFSINPSLGSGDLKWIFPTKNPKSSFLKITILYIILNLRSL